jgi:hypothetical protein
MGEPAWSKDEDGRPLGFKITEAGLAAIGLGSNETNGESRSTEAKDSEPAAPVSQARPGSKVESVVRLLSRENGASLAELMTVTGWQAHSTRAALTGLRKRG